jgi:NADPH-dependent curcumin reductase CurA
MVGESNFSLEEAEIPEPREGQILVRNLFLSFDPAMRGWLEDRRSYVPPVAIGEVMRASAVGQVIASRHPDFKVGDFAQGTFGWQDYAVAAPQRDPTLRRVPADVPLTWPLGVLGGTGLTAYFGLLEVGRPRPGDTVVVSGAAGATGSVAGQVAKIAGCRVVGIAGGPEKCRWLTEEAHFDAAVDYKSENVRHRVRELCPSGVDIYFDNVGGEILNTLLTRLAPGGRVVICGGISTYNAAEPPPGPTNYLALIVLRARMEGFLVSDYLSRFPEAVRRLTEWVAEGRITHAEDVQEGLENAPRTLLRLFEGKNLGKQLLRVADPPLEAP